MYRPGDPPPTQESAKDGVMCQILDSSGKVVREFYCNGKPSAEVAGCEEDMACWDCSTMGNRVCGPQGDPYLVTPSVPTTDVLAAPGTTQPASRPSGELPVTGGGFELVWVALVLVLCGVGAVLWAKITA